MRKERAMLHKFFGYHIVFIILPAYYSVLQDVYKHEGRGPCTKARP
jgi:hypothetical protein